MNRKSAKNLLCQTIFWFTKKQTPLVWSFPYIPQFKFREPKNHWTDPVFLQVSHSDLSDIAPWTYRNDNLDDSEFFEKTHFWHTLPPGSSDIQNFIERVHLYTDKTKGAILAPDKEPCNRVLEGSGRKTWLAVLLQVELYKSAPFGSHSYTLMLGIIALLVGEGAKCPNDSLGSLKSSFSFLCVSYINSFMRCTG